DGFRRQLQQLANGLCLFTGQGHLAQQGGGGPFLALADGVGQLAPGQVLPLLGQHDHFGDVVAIHLALLSRDGCLDGHFEHIRPARKGVTRRKADRYSLKRCTCACRLAPSRASSWLAAAVWPLAAAVCSETSRMFSTLRLSSLATLACCSAAVAICWFMAWMVDTISVMAPSETPVLWPISTVRSLSADIISTGVRHSPRSRVSRFMPSSCGSRTSSTMRS